MSPIVLRRDDHAAGALAPWRRSVLPVAALRSGAALLPVGRIGPGPAFIRVG